MKRLKARLAEILKAIRNLNVLRWIREVRERRRERNDLKRALRDSIQAREEDEEHLRRLIRDGREDSQTAKMLAIRIEHLDKRIGALRVRKGEKTDQVNAAIEEAEDRKKRKAGLEAARRKVKKKIEAIANREPPAKWPISLNVAELLYHLGHCHLASPEREKLIQIGRIAESRGIRVGEFPPFDTVESVHANPGSWHYRDSSNPWTSRYFSNRGDGLAMDLNDEDGGSDKEIAFYYELVRRY